MPNNYRLVVLQNNWKHMNLFRDLLRILLCNLGTNKETLNVYDRSRAENKNIKHFRRIRARIALGRDIV